MGTQHDTRPRVNSKQQEMNGMACRQDCGKHDKRHLVLDVVAGVMNVNYEHALAVLFERRNYIHYAQHMLCMAQWSNFL